MQKDRELKILDLAVMKAEKKVEGAKGSKARKEAMKLLEKAKSKRMEGSSKVKSLLKDMPFDRSDGKGVELIYDSASRKFILSDRVEDDLITLMRNDYLKGYFVQSAVTRYGHHELGFLDSERQRLWRRFVRLTIDPQLDDEVRLLAIRSRRAAAAALWEEKNVLKRPANIEYPLTDSDEEEQRQIGIAKKEAAALKKKMEKEAAEKRALEKAAAAEKKAAAEERKAAAAAES